MPETVHHVVVHVDPSEDYSWADKGTGRRYRRMACTTTIRLKGVDTPEVGPEGIKRLKPLMLFADRRLKMAQCLVFCRTNLDCDHLEQFLNAAGGGGGGFKGSARRALRTRIRALCSLGCGLWTSDDGTSPRSKRATFDLWYAPMWPHAVSISKELPCVVQHDPA